MITGLVFIGLVLGVIFAIDGEYIFGCEETRIEIG